MFDFFVFIEPHGSALMTKCLRAHNQFVWYLASVFQNESKKLYDLNNIFAYKCRISSRGTKILTSQSFWFLLLV